jgi:SagB-type dehydrogenase family enzyme
MKGEHIMESMETYRTFLKSDRWDEWAETETDQKKQLPVPPPQKSYPQNATLIDLVAMSLKEAVHRRKSHRKFTDESLTLEELSFLLWATQGVRVISGGGAITRRTVPSGGSRHPFETYLIVNRVNGLEPGLYRYLPLEHKIYFLGNQADLDQKISDACRGQTFVGEGAVVFIWTVIPYRAEWRYSMIAHKIIAMDAGHLCQNLYLASETIGAGTCAIGAYTQSKMDTLVGVDGRDEFVIYAAPVGKVNVSSQHK